MKKNNFQLIIYIVSIVFSFLLFGCVSSNNTLQSYHTSTKFDQQLISQKKWSVDERSIIPSHAIEILQFGGSLYGDFYDIFIENSKSIMASFFGAQLIQDNIEDAEYILIPKIKTTYSKAGMASAWADSIFEIEIQFTVVRRYDKNETILSEISVSGRSASPQGTLYSHPDNAHKRANEAINLAFIQAHEKLAKIFAEKIK